MAKKSATQQDGNEKARDPQGDRGLFAIAA
jgi:hypothetical protein